MNKGNAYLLHPYHRFSNRKSGLRGSDRKECNRKLKGERFSPRAFILRLRFSPQSDVVNIENGEGIEHSSGDKKSRPVVGTDKKRVTPGVLEKASRRHCQSHAQFAEVA